MSDFNIVVPGVRSTLGEGAYWSARESLLYWVDILGGVLHSVAPNGSNYQNWKFDQPICWIAETTDSLIAGLDTEVVALTLDFFARRPVASFFVPEGQRLNDCKVDRQGRIWAGTMRREADTDEGVLQVARTTDVWTVADTGYRVTNGPAFSPDGLRMYHADSGRGLVYGFDIAPSGKLLNKSIFCDFADLQGVPDGMTADSEGGLWVAHWDGGRVSRFHPDGSWDRSILLPASRVTNCTFGGDDLDRLFVTTASLERLDEPYAGCTFEVDPEVRGLPPSLCTTLTL